MIVAVAAAAALATSRPALIGQWLRANPVHSASSLSSRFPTAATPDLGALAQRELTNRGRYQLAAPSAPPAGEPWWLRAWDWLYVRWLRVWHALFARVHVGGKAVASAGDLLLVLVGLVMLSVGVRLLRNIRIARSESRAPVEPLVEPPTPRALYRQACDAAARADYGSAALLLFAATVALLNGYGAVAGTSSATVGDLRRELRVADEGLLAHFDAVAMPFVQTAYAERAVNEPQWHVAHDAFKALLQAGVSP